MYDEDLIQFFFIFHNLVRHNLLQYTFFLPNMPQLALHISDFHNFFRNPTVMNMVAETFYNHHLASKVRKKFLKKILSCYDSLHCIIRCANADES